MKTRKKERAYLLILIFSIFLIYNTFRVAFADVILSQNQEKMNVFLLSFDIYIYLIIGLLLVGLTIYIYINLSAYYMVGKLFVVYLSFISTGICLVAATNYQYVGINVFINVLAFFSNIFLYYSIGFLTLIAKKKYFKWMTGFYILLTIVIIVLTLFYREMKNAIITGDYIVTTIVIIVSMLYGYHGSTVYSKRQIKFLSFGLAMGIVIFIIMQFMPMLAVVKISENNMDSKMNYQLESMGSDEEQSSIIRMENSDWHQNIYPIMAYTGIIIAMIYILVKREFLEIDESKELKRYILSIIYLIVANTYFYLFLSDYLAEYIAFNGILIMPLLIYNHRIFNSGGCTNDSSMNEMLEEERQRLSIFLHDEILQDLIALSHSIKMEGTEERLSSIIGEIRHISQELYPTIVEDLGLEQSLSLLIDDIGNDYNVGLEYKYHYPQGILPKGISLVIYRTVKELVTNAIKHSKCNQISIIINQIPEGIECIVSDNGIGFQISENEESLKSPHMGLNTVRRQIANSNGNMRIISDKTGSEFHIHIPLR